MAVLSTEARYAVCSPTSDGSAAVILASEDFVRRHKLQGQAVEVVGMEMGTDTPSTFGRSSMSLVRLGCQGA